MGHKLSKEQAFIKDLKASLKERGVRIKKKDLVKFFIFIDEVCPWFLVTGPEIHPQKWQKVGKDLNDKLRKEGPNSVPTTVFSYWGLIRDIVDSASDDPDKQQLLSVAEFCLRPLSLTASVASIPLADKNPSRPPSIIEMPAIQRESLYPPLPQETPPSDYPLNLPIFTKNSDDDTLEPGDAAVLEEEAAHYHNPDGPPLTAQSSQYPPPYAVRTCAPALSAPALPPATLIEAKNQLSAQVNDLKEVPDLQRQFVQLSTELSSLQNALKETILLQASSPAATPPSLPYKKGPPSKSKDLINKSKNLKLTRAHKSSAPSLDDPPLSSREERVLTSPSRGSPFPSDSEGESENEKGNEEDDQAVQDAPPREFRKLHFKTLKDLNAAVKAYGPNAPFTLSALEAMSRGGYLLPSEWIRVVQAVLSRGQFLTWKADFFDRCQSTAAANLKSPHSPSASWTFEKLSGQGKYASEAQQQRFPVGLLAQTANAALAAWRTLPNTGSPFAPLNKIVQGSQEDFSEYVSRLLEAAERTLGHEAASDQLVKRLAYENANSACRAVLRGRFRDKTLDDMVRMCRDIDPLSTKM
ncbi:endogenous retrovirus group K member 10 Gag polyprotein-like [Sarcophilus harrisii]|uniref:endogenous retrovirus group K member 10 Gag polyprotein-like n=1 Tax=Sarcophilus harrisii TaxID=9305 RepID=UPI001301FB56|nr:endogenous retrovirus group K member 10 Gag polyprotein-like [Sarcophilus harrisii]